MRSITSFVLAGFASLALSSAATATDLYTEYTPTPVVDQGGFDWNGFYLGVLGGIYTETGSNGITASKIAGFNFTNGHVLFGAEAEALYMWNYAGVPGNNYPGFGGRGRLGILAGDSALLYATAGFFSFGGGGGQGPTAGAGAEFAFSDNLVGRADFQAIFGPVSTAYFGRAGLVWVFH